jgi:hypothetical protein
LKMSEMNVLEEELDDCLQQMSDGSRLDECLRRYPDQARELKPMLETAVGFGRGRELTPSPAFKRRARRTLTDYWQAHPQRRAGPSRLALRLAAAIVVTVALLTLVGTAYAQNALPGQTLYDWKITSEKAWRAVAPDPVAVDLSIADRRADELMVVVRQSEQPGQQGRKAEAIQNYQQSLQQLQTDANASKNASDKGQIMRALESHKKKFTDAGIDDPQLDEIFHGKP